MTRTYLRQACALLVVLCGLLLLIAHLAHWTTVVAPLSRVDTKPITAGLFVLSGLLVLLPVPGWHRSLQALLYSLLGYLTASVVLGAWLFINPPVGAAAVLYTVGEGLPSIGTLVGFAIVGVGGRLVPVRSYLLAALASFAAVGHLTHIPALFFYDSNYSTGMAVPTVTLFGLLAVAVWRR